jgi:regulatory protein
MPGQQMPGRRRARTGRGWDAAPPGPRRAGAPRREGASRNSTLRNSGPGDSASGDSASRDSAELAREICLNQLAVRPRTRAELAEVLRRRGVAAEVAQQVLERYSEVGMIDDQAFARAWVTSRHHGRGLARRALADELRRKGVDALAIGTAMDCLDESAEEEMARTLVARRLRLERGNPEAAFRRLVGLLARKGYPAGLAIRVVKEALAERAESADFAGELDIDALADQAREEEARHEDARDDLAGAHGTG